MAEKDKEHIMVRVGKYGMTPEVISEIRTILKKHKTIQVKLLKTSLEGKDRREMCEKIRTMAKARHADMRGHIITLRE